jgi:hypothetical protein
VKTGDPRDPFALAYYQVCMNRYVWTSMYEQVRMNRYVWTGTHKYGAPGCLHFEHELGQVLRCGECRAQSTGKCLTFLTWRVSHLVLCRRI